MIGKDVLVRTYSAGVHFGKLKSINGKEVVLENATRIWRWSGANSLSEMSQNGIHMDNSRVSIAVPEILLSEAIEVISCSEIAAKNLRVSRWS